MIVVTAILRYAGTPDVLFAAVDGVMETKVGYTGGTSVCFVSSDF